MAALSKHPLDILAWMRKLISTCDTQEQFSFMRSMILHIRRYFEHFYPSSTWEYRAVELYLDLNARQEYINNCLVLEKI